MDPCLACDLSNGTLSLPGGRIHATEHWVVEHCVGPLGAGTLIVKPKRHVTAVGELTPAEAAELGPLLQRASAVAQGITGADQVYNCLWAHAGSVPRHLHYVVQPVTSAQIDAAGEHGPRLQALMFSAGELPHPQDLERAADAAREAFAQLGD